MENEKKKRTIKMYLHPNEAWVIEQWRTKFRFGILSIVMKDGVPQGMEKILLKFRPPKDYKLKEKQNDD